MRIATEQQIDVLEVYCGTCKRPYDDCNDEPCILGDHLRGGPIGERKKRGPAMALPPLAETG